jgi:hypothetical protein
MDYVAASFVQSGDDVQFIRKTLDERVADLERRCDEYDRLLRLQTVSTTNPRNMGRYMLRLTDGTSVLVVTFEREEKHYILHLENGRRVRYEHKSIKEIEYLSFSK